MGFKRIYANVSCISLYVNRWSRIWWYCRLFNIIKSLRTKHITITYLCYLGTWQFSPLEKAIYSEYKQNRKKPDASSHNNKTNQLLCLIRILYHTPVCQVFISKCEGDDIIAQLCNDNFKEHKKIIVSTDKDFYQLLNDNTTIFSPVTKVYINSNIVAHKYNIAAENFALYKALTGDPSDNIKGIKGLGQKRVLKFFPDIRNTKLCLNDIRNLCLEKQNTNKIYSKILNDFNHIRTNLSIIQLENTLLI